MSYDTNKAMQIVAKAVREKRCGFHPSKGNSKTGSIAGFSLAPLFSCTMEACATCGEQGCYALKNMLCHGYDIEKNNVLRAWAENTALVVNHIETFAIEMDRVLDSYKGRFYRIHPAGDFITTKYAIAWCYRAKRHPEIEFLAFTKQWDVVRAIKDRVPKNLHIVASGWPGAEIPQDIQEMYRCSYCVEKGQEPPKDAIECPGNCETCNACWMLEEIGKNVWFRKH